MIIPHHYPQTKFFCREVLYVLIDCNQHICRNNAYDLDCTNYHVKPVNLKFYTKTVKTALSFKNLLE